MTVGRLSGRVPSASHREATGCCFNALSRFLTQVRANQTAPTMRIATTATMANLSIDFYLRIHTPVRIVGSQADRQQPARFQLGKNEAQNTKIDGCV